MASAVADNTGNAIGDDDDDAATTVYEALTPGEGDAKLASNNDEELHPGSDARNLFDVSFLSHLTSVL